MAPRRHRNKDPRAQGLWVHDLAVEGLGISWFRALVVSGLKWHWALEITGLTEFGYLGLSHSVKSRCYGFVVEARLAKP